MTVLDNVELVEVFPIEYNPSQRYFSKKKRKYVKKNPRLQIYWGYSFSPHLTQANIERIVSHLRHRKEISVQSTPDGSIIWKYSGKPPIHLSITKGKTFVSKETLERFGRQSCQQQASYVLRVLKGSARQRETRPTYAKFTRISVTCDPNRIGRNEIEREIYFQAVRDLFDDYQYQCSKVNEQM